MRKERVDNDNRLFRVTLDEGVPFAIVSLKLSTDEIGVIRGKDGPFFVGEKGRSRVFETDHDGPCVGKDLVGDAFNDAG